MLSNGSSGDEVTQLQEDLAKLGLDPGPVDGIFGPKTAAAVKAFQESAGTLAIDGIAGPKTLAALRTRLTAEPPRPRGTTPPQSTPPADPPASRPSPNLGEGSPI